MTAVIGVVTFDVVFTESTNIVHRYAKLPQMVFYLAITCANITIMFFLIKFKQHCERFDSYFTMSNTGLFHSW